MIFLAPGPAREHVRVHAPWDRPPTFPDDVLGCGRDMNLLHYGLQRSGTNYFEALVTRFYRVELVNEEADRASPAQKHFRLYDDKHAVPHPDYQNEVFLGSFAELETLLPKRPDHYVVISKDPYSWLLSYRRWAQECGWPPVSHHYLEEYNLFYGRWLTFASQTDRIHFVRYHDLLVDADATLDALAGKTGMERRSLAGLRSSRIWKVPQSGLFSPEKRDFYVERKYLRSFDPDELTALDRILDRQVMDGLGYAFEGG